MSMVLRDFGKSSSPSDLQILVFEIQSLQHLHPVILEAVLGCSAHSILNLERALKQ